MKIKKSISLSLIASMICAILPGVAVNADTTPYYSIPVDLVAEGIANYGRFVTNGLFNSPESSGVHGDDLMSLCKGTGEYNYEKDVEWDEEWENISPVVVNSTTDIRTNTLTFNGIKYNISIPFKTNTPEINLNSTGNSVIYKNGENKGDDPWYNNIDIPDGYYKGISLLGGGLNEKNGMLIRYVYEDGLKSNWQQLKFGQLTDSTSLTGADDYLQFGRYVTGGEYDNENLVYVQQLKNINADITKKIESLEFISKDGTIYSNGAYHYDDEPTEKGSDYNYTFVMMGMSLLQDGAALGEELRDIYAKKPTTFMGTDGDYAWYESLKKAYNKAIANQNEDYNDLYTEVQTYIDEFTDPTGNIELLVSPDGSDTADGTNAAPLKSIDAAMNKAKEIAENANSTRDVTITLAGGEYEVTQTINVTGFNGAVTIKAAEGETPCIKGSKTIRVEDMLPESVGGRIKKEGIRSYSLAEYTLAENICTEVESTKATNTFGVYVNDEIKPIAEYPDNDELQVDDEYANKNPGDDNDIVLQANTKFGDYKNYDDWYIEGYFKEIYRTYKVAESNFTVNSDNTLTFNSLKSSGVSGINRNWKIFNVLEELTVAGEWYVDANPEVKKLYYLPGEETEIDISNMTDALVGINQDNVTISGIAFKNTCGNAVEIANGKSSITINNCDFKAIGRNAIVGNATIMDTNIFGNTMENIGYRGIHLGSGNLDNLTASGNVIAENRISYPGKVVRSYAHAIMITGVGVEVKNNEISNTKSIALGFEGALHKIHHNKLTEVVTEAKDAGAIYSGRNLKYLGNEIYNNDITLPERDSTDEVIGIYLDDFLSGTEVHHNIIRNGSRGIYSNGGAENKIYNNVYIGCDKGTTIRKRVVPDTWKEALTKPTSEAFVEEFNYLDEFDDVNTWPATYIQVYDNYCVDVNTILDLRDYTQDTNEFIIYKNENNVAVAGELEGLAKADIDKNYIGIPKTGLDETIAYAKIDGTKVTVDVVSTYKSYKVVAAVFNAGGKMVEVKILDGTDTEFAVSETPAIVKVIVVENFNTMKPMTR